MPTTAQQLSAVTRKLETTERARRYAWRQYFDSERRALEVETITYRTFVRVVESDIPEHIINELREDMEALKKEISCPICLDIIDAPVLAVSKCGHKYCKTCLDTLKGRPNVDDRKCGICRKNL